MTGTEIVSEIVSILVSGIQGIGTGIGQGVSNFVQNLAFTGTGSNQQLSVYFIMVIVFGAIALAVGLTRLIFNWLSNLGGN